MNGVREIELYSWKYFHDFVYQEMLERTLYIWRGQRDANWSLVSTLDRALEGRLSDKLISRHLENFKFSARGRRGVNPDGNLTENDWWALGQHYGLATPLLDWTHSPFAAAYFAFHQNKKSQSNRRAVWAFSTFSSQKKSKEIRAKWESGEHSSPPSIVEFFRPMTNENSRLVNQAGLFTRTPVGVALDDWVKENFYGEKKRAMLIKITIPDGDRDDCLRSLNRMNINHLSLFPDLYGAGAFCNAGLSISNY